MYAKEASLGAAKRIMGLRAVFGEVFDELFWMFNICPGWYMHDTLNQSENTLFDSLSY